MGCGSFSVLLGDGKGNFSFGPLSPMAIPPTGITFAKAVAVLDCDGDGIEDVLLYDNLLNLYGFKCRGDGTFETQRILQYGPKRNTILDWFDIYYFSACDIDNDGKKELMVQTAACGFSVGLTQESLIIYSVDNFKFSEISSLCVGGIVDICPMHTDTNGLMKYAIIADRYPPPYGPGDRAIFLWTPRTKYSGPFYCNKIPSSITYDKEKLFIACKSGEIFIASYTKYYIDASIISISATRKNIPGTLRAIDLDSNGAKELVLLESDDIGVVLLSVYDKSYNLLQKTNLNGRLYIEGSYVVRDTFQDINHDGNIDLLTIGTTPSATSISNLVACVNMSKHTYGYSYLGVKVQNPKVQLACLGDAVVGNNNFYIKVTENRPGFLLWNFIAWPEYQAVILGHQLGIYVPPRIAVPIGEPLHLPIPTGNIRLQMFPHYFQWVGLDGTSSDVMKVVVGPQGS